MPRIPKFSAAAAPIEKPLPLWILYPLFFTILYASHYSLLRLPFYWDEAGYYIPAALDFYQHHTLIPQSTLTNAHPPLPSILLAAWWHLTGYVISGTRTFILMVAAAALLGVFRLARALAGTMTAATVTLLTAIYPVWFTQSTLAHADIFAAAFTLWALSFYLEAESPGALSATASSKSVEYQAKSSTSRNLAIAALFTLAALSKETAIVTPVCLALWEVTLYLTEKRHPRQLAALLAPILPLALWYAYHRHVTGFTFGNPEFLRYNATANLTPLRILLSFWHRVVHLAFHMNLWVPLLCTVAALSIPRQHPATAAPEAEAGAWVRPPHLSPESLKSIAIVLAGNTLAFSVLGGALLTRYLLPLYPLLLLLYISLWRSRLKQWPLLAALTSVAFLSALFINPPYPFAPEDNLTYRDFIVLHQQAAAILAQRYPYATVLTAWPAITELEHPLLGYVRRPIKVLSIDNFSAPQIDQAATNPGAYDTALVFSTKWTPAGANFAQHSHAADTRYFDYHDDLPPAEIAARLHGDLVWQRSEHGEWAAIIRFPRSNEAENVQRGSLR